MTTVATNTSTTPASDIDSDDGYDTGTDVAAVTPQVGAEIVSDNAVVGEIVDEPAHLNTGDQPDRMPFRAGVLDARLLRESTRFSRENVGDLSELVASIQDRRGVKLPLIVLSVDGPDAEREDFEIVDGLRRKLAAVEAGYPMVPCWIVDDEADIELILDMLAVNENRKDLENVEIARAYQTMLDLGLSEQQIADARRIRVDQVRTAVRARQLPAPAHRALNAGTLTFDMVQAIDEFADAPADQDRLLDEVGDAWRFRQVLARLREKRSYQRERDLAKARLLLDGVDLTPRPRALDYSGGPIPVDKLVDADGEPVDVETVKTLPGFHGFVEKNGGQARTIVYCDDPAAHGFQRRTSTSPGYFGMTEAEVAAKQEQERLTAERVDRLRLAADVRREFVVSAYGTAKAAKTLFVEALRAVAVGVELTGTDLDDLFTALGGSDHEVLATAGEDRLRRTLVAKFICRQEHNLDLLLAWVGGRYAYGLDEQAVIAWYDRLTGQGYPLTEDEQVVLDELTAKLTAQASEDEDEDLHETEEGDEDAAEPADDGGASPNVSPVTADADPEPEDVQAADVEAAPVVEVAFGADGPDESDDEDDDLSRFEAAA